MIGLICSSTCFVLAIQHAQVAHVLLLLNTTPVIAGLLSWLIIGEKINRLTWILIGISIVGSTLIVMDSTAMGESGSSAFGLLMALGAALATAINFWGHVLVLPWMRPLFLCLPVSCLVLALA